jgi:ribulose-bisphosphate carboxylase large chain
MKVLEKLRVLDLIIPTKMQQLYKGPQYGIEGIRNTLKIYDRPLCGTIVKPKVGLPTEYHARVAYEAWVGGVDIVKDDENLGSQVFNQFEDRLYKTLEMRDKAQEETGEKKMYMINITAPYREMVRRAQMVEDAGNEYMMVDVVCVGFSALQSLREEGFKLILHAHRAMHAAMTRSKDFGISMLTLAKLYRLIGVDQLHIGTIVGKMEGDAKEVLQIRDAITKDEVEEFGEIQKWVLKPVMPVSSGGLHPGHVPDLYKYFGKDVIMQFGGGIHGHPNGTQAGARAVRQAIDATLQGIPLEEYAKDHEELRKALMILPKKEDFTLILMLKNNMSKNLGDCMFMG